MEKANTTFNHLDLILVEPSTQEQQDTYLFSGARRTFAKVDHILGYKTSHNKSKRDSSHTEKSWENHQILRN